MYAAYFKWHLLLVQTSRTLSVSVYLFAQQRSWTASLLLTLVFWIAEFKLWIADKLKEGRRESDMFMVDAIRSVFLHNLFFPEDSLGNIGTWSVIFHMHSLWDTLFHPHCFLSQPKLMGVNFFLYLLCWHFCCMPCTDHHGICSSLRENTTINLARRKSSVTYPSIPREEPLGTPVPMTTITMNFGQSKEPWSSCSPTHQKNLCFLVPLIPITSVLGVESLLRAWAKLAE